MAVVMKNVIVLRIPSDYIMSSLSYTHAFAVVGKDLQYPKKILQKDNA
jgi:hypothetical protein